MWKPFLSAHLSCIHCAFNALQLAAAQRMSTDVRRAVFVAVMGSDDCMEAFEKLMRLPIKVSG
jgi:nucleolar MIF4G domain-containing protein 1